MSICTFIASDHPLPELRPQRNYPLEINLDTGTIYDGGADDNFFLHSFRDVQCYTDLKYGVYLEWNYTEGRARYILEYIKEAFEKTEYIELWHVWLMDYYEYEESPVIHRRRVHVEKLNIEDIKMLNDAEIWNTPDKTYPNRPSFYCIEII